MILLRSVMVSLMIAGPPVYQIKLAGYQQKQGLLVTEAHKYYYPIPPNLECVDSCDMALHIPIAVDYFYEYLT